MIRCPSRSISSIDAGPPITNESSSPIPIFCRALEYSSFSGYALDNVSNSAGVAKPALYNLSYSSNALDISSNATFPSVAFSKNIIGLSCCISLIYLISVVIRTNLPPI